MKIKQLMDMSQTAFISSPKHAVTLFLLLTDVPSIDHYTAGRVANKKDRYRKMDASPAAPSLPEGKCSTP
jgi:hypothetical protein